MNVSRDMPAEQRSRLKADIARLMTVSAGHESSLVAGGVLECVSDWTAAFAAAEKALSAIGLNEVVLWPRLDGRGSTAEARRCLSDTVLSR